MNFETTRKLAIAGIAGIASLTFGGMAFNATGHRIRNDYTATVTDKTATVIGDAQNRYLIFTRLPDGSVKVFEDTDSLLEGKFNSSDMYALIEKGKTYKFNTYGRRIPFMSAYENIVGVQEVKPQK